MNACSSEAFAGARWCSRTPLANAMSPILSVLSPAYLQLVPRRRRPPRGGARGRDRPGQRVRLRCPGQHGQARAAGDELGHAAVGDELAPADHDQVISGVLHLRHQVTGHENRAALGGQPLHQVADPQDALRVQAVHRLVEHQDSGSPSSVAAMPSRWLIPSENPLGPLAGHVGQSHDAERLVHPAAGDAVGLGQAAQMVVGAAPPCTALASSSAPTSDIGLVTARTACRSP